ncbi:ferric reductase-like transmembrane domain-containing protein [Actibacterium lipolyticum]|uniref:Ferric reductase like transmembrane component n=1 Tax=Actibacterium lipolyticum TaxID=1524263 RepID=A0A238L8Q5_9RHOB|nr:ferric reductase-like transmembrane domain-containing protein [Actibacterium lipolyticum]SMX51210.1 Ferric reductase like transmembrane component [Actibacterium lipolyticum]
MAVLRAILIWSAIVGVIGASLVVAAGSEYLAYRSPAYVAAGFAGVTALALLLVQPLLAARLLPGIPMQAGRRIHRWTGVALVLAIAVHVVGLWITSPPDMVDALTFTAPTAFSAFGVVAMWALIAAALLAGIRQKLRLRPQVWRLGHTMAASIVVVGSVAHAILIEGTMGTESKTLMCAAAIGAWALAVGRLKPWTGVRRGWRRQSRQ